MLETPHPYGSQPKTDFVAQLERALAAAGCASLGELAGLLKIQAADITAAEQHGFFPAEWVVRLLELKGVNPAWIRTGRGSRLIPPPASAEWRGYPEDSSGGTTNSSSGDLPGDSSSSKSCPSPSAASPSTPSPSAAAHSSPEDCTTDELLAVTPALQPC